MAFFIASLLFALRSSDRLRFNNGELIYHLAEYGPSKMIEKLIELGFTTDDLRVRNNYPLRAAGKEEGRLKVIQTWFIS